MTDLDVKKKSWKVMTLPALKSSSYFAVAKAWWWNDVIIGPKATLFNRGVGSYLNLGGQVAIWGAQLALSGWDRGTSMYYVITKEGRGHKKMAIFDYIRLVLKVITKGRGRGGQKTPNLDYWPAQTWVGNCQPWPPISYVPVYCIAEWFSAVMPSYLLQFSLGSVSFA